jgi:sulfur-carrier protein adenylyltransferase/sulfurtransferase
VCLGKMSAGDLIIDCTADERVFNLLCSVAKRDQKKFLWAAVFEGGRGGQIARYIPNISALPQIIRAAYNEFCLKNPSPIVKAAEDYIREDLEGRVIVASDADISVIADSAARFAIDCLLEIYEYEFPMYLIGMGKWWIFRSPLEVIPITCVPVLQEKVDQESEPDEDGKNFLKDLIKKSDQA